MVHFSRGWVLAGEGTIQLWLASSEANWAEVQSRKQGPQSHPVAPPLSVLQSASAYLAAQNVSLQGPLWHAWAASALVHLPRAQLFTSCKPSDALGRGLV